MRIFFLNEQVPAPKGPDTLLAGFCKTHFSLAVFLGRRFQ